MQKINKDYEIIEHTADIGIRVKARDPKELFVKTALSMFDIIAQPEIESKPSKDIEIKLKAGDLDELFVTWLNELLSLSATKELIFSVFRIKKIGKNNLDAIVSGSDIKNYRLNTEIKAATYHQLKLEETESGWLAEVIFDV
ncbi:MAG: archease [Candidatus Omnitrophota bacterium]